MASTTTATGATCPTSTRSSEPSARSGAAPPTFANNNYHLLTMRKHLHWALALALLWGYSCGDGQGAGNVAADSLPDSTASAELPKAPEPLAISAELTNLAKVIAGMPVEEPVFDSIQHKDFYKRHQSFVDTTWASIERKHLVPVEKWRVEEGISTEADTATLFYPFSGPDILYANAFFPSSRTYIMAGLELMGTLPKFADMSAANQDNYFRSIQKSLEYLNNVGYFVTQHMGRDFTREHLNGTLHMILYFLARTHHDIIDVSYVALAPDGSEAASDGRAADKINALKVDFVDHGGFEKQTVYYFKLDISDGNLQQHPEFFSFLDRHQCRYAYMKSASYILFNPTFVKLRDKILAQSTKILQDDTGIPLRDFDRAAFDLRLYGTYTGVVRDFGSYCFQPDLRDSLKTSQPLPFQISYNAWKNEGMLLFAQKR